MLIENNCIDGFISQNGLSITRYYRNQTKQDNLLGNRVIDRGAMKFKISIKFNLVSSMEWSPLLTSFEKISFNVTFYDAKLGTITRKFSIDSISTPRFITLGNVEYYKDVSVVLEEL